MILLNKLELSAIYKHRQLMPNASLDSHNIRNTDELLQRFTSKGTRQICVQHYRSSFSTNFISLKDGLTKKYKFKLQVLKS